MIFTVANDDSYANDSYQTTSINNIYQTTERLGNLHSNETNHSGSDRRV